MVVVALVLALELVREVVFVRSKESLVDDDKVGCKDVYCFCAPNDPLPIKPRQLKE